jgi:hypothetical protein
MLAQEMVESNASNAVAQSHLRSRSPVPTTQQPVQHSTRHQSSIVAADQQCSNMDAVAVVERVMQFAPVTQVSALESNSHKPVIDS